MWMIDRLRVAMAMLENCRIGEMARDFSVVNADDREVLMCACRVES